MAYDVEINAHVTIAATADQPVRFTVAVATTASRSGEQIEIIGVLGNPFVFIMRGEKLYGEINVEPMIQEALLHVQRENATT